MTADPKIIPLGNYKGRPIGEVHPIEEVAEQQRIIRELSARYRRLRKGVSQSPPNGKGAA